MLKLASFFLALVLLAFTSFVNNQPEAGKTTASLPLTHNQLPPSAPQEIQSPPIPATLTFAGEKVPLEDADIRERLEKEILSNTFYHSKTLQIIKLANRWRGPIEKVMKENGLPSDFFYLAVAESALDENAVSSASAIGMWQFMASVAKEYDLEINSYVDMRRDPIAATKAASAYLTEMKGIFGSWTNAAAAYNRGKTGLSNALKEQKVSSYYDLYLNPETYRYVFRILAYKAIMEAPAKYGFVLEKDDLYAPFTFTEVTIDSTINDLPAFAQQKGTTYKMLKKLNPWLDINAKYMLYVPSGGSYTLKIPK
ncbi:transglycosylase SLT domain-containing protein [bacterium]|nr:transglycosylase SLT domain-containing protein [bacterium]